MICSPLSLSPDPSTTTPSILQNIICKCCQVGRYDEQKRTWWWWVCNERHNRINFIRHPAAAVAATASDSVFGYSRCKYYRHDRQQDLITIWKR